jgi:hypothetical protein
VLLAIAAWPAAGVSPSTRTASGRTDTASAGSAVSGDSLCSFVPELGLLLRRSSTMVPLVRRSSSARGKTVTRTRDELVQIACDESGYKGAKLIGATTDVFAHASVLLDAESATRCMQELRNRIRSPATEYKANHLLREKHRSVLEWLLGPSGPLHNNAHVYLVDKAFLVAGKIIGLLHEDVSHLARTGLYQDQRARDMTVSLYRDGRRTFDRELWEAFLASSNNLMRAKDRLDVRTSVDSFFRTVDALRLAGTPGQVGEILGLLSQARPHAEAFRRQLRDNPTMIPVLDPLVPAIVRAVAHWGDSRRPISIIHDRQNTLSERRIAQVKETSACHAPLFWVIRPALT